MICRDCGGRDPGFVILASRFRAMRGGKRGCGRVQWSAAASARAAGRWKKIEVCHEANSPGLFDRTRGAARLPRGRPGCGSELFARLPAGAYPTPVRNMSGLVSGYEAWQLHDIRRRAEIGRQVDLNADMFWRWSGASSYYPARSRPGRWCPAASGAGRPPRRRRLCRGRACRRNSIPNTRNLRSGFSRPRCCRRRWCRNRPTVRRRPKVCRLRPPIFRRRPSLN